MRILTGGAVLQACVGMVLLLTAVTFWQ